MKIMQKGMLFLLWVFSLITVIDAFMPILMHDVGNLLYQKNLDHASSDAVERLLTESIITPEMQWSLLSLLGAQQMTINVATGQVQHLPSVQTVIETIRQKLYGPVYVADKEQMKNSLHALLEAIDLAIFTASIESLYQGNGQQLSPETIRLIDQLKAVQAEITSAISSVNSVRTIDQDPQASSYFSWIPFFGSSTKSNYGFGYGTNQQIYFDQQNPAVANIPATMMPTLIAANDYKQMQSMPIQGANLLFKQIFIAQQHHLKDSYRIAQLRINVSEPFDAQTYIFTQFPALFDQYSHSYPICRIAQNLVHNVPRRQSVHAPLRQEHRQAHQLLLHIRQAIATALYVANKKSGYNAGNILPASITSYLDGIVKHLLAWDAHVAQLCIDPVFGATQLDLDQQSTFATNVKVIAGVAVTVGIIATIVYTNPLGAGDALQSVGSTISAPVYNTASSIASYAKSWVPGFFGGENGSTSRPEVQNGTQTAQVSSSSASTNNSQIDQLKRDIAENEKYREIAKRNGKEFSEKVYDDQIKSAKEKLKKLEEEAKNPTTKIIATSSTTSATPVTKVLDVAANARINPINVNITGVTHGGGSVSATVPSASQNVTGQVAGPVTAAPQSNNLQELKLQRSMIQMSTLITPEMMKEYYRLDDQIKQLEWNEKNSFEKVKHIAGEAWGLASDGSSKAMALGGATLIATRGLQGLEGKRIGGEVLVPVGTYDKITGGYGNYIEGAAGLALTGGGIISGINHGIGAYNTAITSTKQHPDFLSKVDKTALERFFDMLGLVSGASSVAGAMSSINNLGEKYFRSTQGQQIPPQKLYESLSFAIRDVKTSANNPDDIKNVLVNSMKILMEKTTPQATIMIFSQIIKDHSQDPVIAETAQIIVEFLQQNS